MAKVQQPPSEYEGTTATWDQVKQRSDSSSILDGRLTRSVIADEEVEHGWFLFHHGGAGRNVETLRHRHTSDSLSLIPRAVESPQPMDNTPRAIISRRYENLDRQVVCFL
jgi:hypothetical protein